MYVCVCKAVTDTTVREVIAEGAETIIDVTRACSAGGDCGSCHDMIECMLQAANAAPSEPRARALHVLPRRTHAA